jgi:uncharacterized protein
VTGCWQQEIVMEIANRTSLVILQPTPFCNIDCAYCYLPNRSDKTRLSPESIGLLFERLIQFPTIADVLTLVWHAGEPLVLGPKWYEESFKRIKDATPAGLAVHHAIQTNGTLLNDRWCQLFAQWDVNIGVSIDGPKELHDLSRVARDGSGTFDKVLAGINCLRRNRIPFHVISVLSPASLEQVDELFHFYRVNEIAEVGLNFEEQEGINKRSVFGSGFSDRCVVKFFERLTELMIVENFPIQIRELEQSLNAISAATDADMDNHQAYPFGIITIDVHGDVYTFSPELAGYSSADLGSFAIGNIFKHSFAELAQSNTLRRLTEEVERGIDLCKMRCEYFPVCGGGAPGNKLFENGTFASTETTYCRLTKKRVTDFVLTTIETRLLNQGSNQDSRRAQFY